MQVGVIPAHGDLQGMMKIGDGAVAAHQNPAPDQRCDLTQPDVELIDFNDGGRLAHGIASLPRLTTMSSQRICRQPPLCDGLQVADIETADLGRAHYDMALARFVLMHARELAGTLNRIALSLKETGTLAIVTNVVEGAPTALRTFLEELSGIMKLMLQVQGQPIRVANYVRTREEYVKAVRQAGLRLAWCEAYEPNIVRFDQERPGMRLSHLVLVGTK
jgi:hypothetical protein